MGIVILLLSFIFSFSLYGKEFGSPEAVLRKLFPGAEIEVVNKILTKDQFERAKKLAKVPIDSRLVSFYLVKKQGQIIAYGYVDIHRVRTLPESVLFVISPEGKIELVEVLSFKEPLEYMADESWLKLFKGKELKERNLRLKRDIPNMTGATLTARAIVKASRRALALWKVLFGGKE